MHTIENISCVWFSWVKDTHQNYLTLEISWITAAIAGTDPEINQGEWLAYKLQVGSFILCT